MWSTKRIKPQPPENGNRTGLAFMVQDAAAVEGLYSDWSKRCRAIAQKLTTDVFGRTFVALDPDGH